MAASASTISSAIKSEARELPEVLLPSANTAKVEADCSAGTSASSTSRSQSPASMRRTALPKAPSAASWIRPDPSTTVSAPPSSTRKPQEARAVEVGTKWELFDRRLLATAALFQTDVDNARTNASTAMRNDRNYRASFAGEYRVRGIELGAAGNITRDWSVFGGLVLLDTEVLESPHRAGHRAKIGQHSADAVLAAVALPVDRPIGGRWNGDVRRARFTAATRRQCREQPYRRLVAVRRICRVRDVEELGDRGVRASTSPTSSITMRSIRRQTTIQAHSPSSLPAAPAT